ncbi:MAG: SDR family oxidoreductase [Myxococcales bacterium]
MKLLVMGATGRTGKRLAALALKKGHQVVAIARSPEKLAGLGAEVVQGSPYERETVARAVSGCDAVVNLLNVSRTSESPWARLAAPPDMISRSCANALEAMAKAGIRRYVTLSTVGAGESWKLMPLPVRLVVKHSNLKAAFDDHTEQERLLAQSSADYTVARAPMLSDKDNASGVLVVKPGEKMKSAISRQTVAEFLLSILESGEHLRETVHVSNR